MTEKTIIDDNIVKDVTMMYTRLAYCYCPHCNAQEDGWHSQPDPKEQPYTCESCGKKYTVSQHADVDFGY
jgi:transposase-like protein